MLNDWSDADPKPKPRRSVALSGEFWLGVVTVLLASALIVGFISWRL